LGCSDLSASSGLNRVKAVEKQKEAFMLQWDTVTQHFKNNADTLQMALYLLDESISLDTTYLSAYQTKINFLNHAREYAKALDVCNLVFSRNLEKDRPECFLIRGMLYDKLNRHEQAADDYKTGISVCEEKLENAPDDFKILSDRALLFLLLEGKERGLQEFGLLLEKPLSKIDRKTTEMLLQDIAKRESSDDFIEFLY
jgi:hypothetical protein